MPTQPERSWNIFYNQWLNLLCIKWVPEDPSTIFLGTIFTQKNPRKLKFHVFFHFNARKHMISSFYLKWIEFTRNCDFVSIYFGSLGTYSWNKIHNFLRIRSTSGKMMMSYVFSHEIEGIHGIWASLHLSSKSGRQKYTAWVPRDPTPSCFCNVMSLFEETNKFFEPNCYT